jgi:hypothetical protein
MPSDVKTNVMTPIKAKILSFVIPSFFLKSPPLGWSIPADLGWPWISDTLYLSAFSQQFWQTDRTPSITTFDKGGWLKLFYIP